MSRLGSLLKKERVAMCLSVRDVASRLKISPTTICDIETGHRKGKNPTAKTLIALCNFYELDMGPILGLLADRRNDIFHCKKCGGMLNEYSSCGKCHTEIKQSRGKNENTR